MIPLYIGVTLPSCRPASRPFRAFRVIANSSMLLVTALALVGCSGSTLGSGDSDDPPVAATPTMLDTSGLRLPMDSYFPTAEQRRTLERAQAILIDKCMQRYGFRYPHRPTGVPNSEPENARRYGISSYSRAASHGYMVDLAPAAKQTTDNIGIKEKVALYGQENQDPAKLPKSQEEAEKSGSGTASIGGRKVPVGGCLYESNLKLFSPTRSAVDFMFVQNLQFEAFGRSQRDPRVLRAVKSWSDCMAGHGYRTDEPLSPVKDLGFKTSEFASPKAIAAAKQDVACKKAVNLVGIWFSVETTYQNRLIDQNAETLKKAKAQLKDRMRLADSFVE